MKPDCSVIGGGIVGAMVTLRLAKRGVKVVWFCGSSDISYPSASQAAGAMLCPFSELDESDNREEVIATVTERMQARDIFEPLFEELNIEKSKLSWRSGIAVIASARHSDRDLQRLQWLSKIASDAGCPVETLSSSDLSFLSPDNENSIIGGILLKREASFDVKEFLKFLWNYLKNDSNVLINGHTVLSAACDKRSTAIIVTTSSDVLHFPKVIIAAGASTTQLLDDDALRKVDLPALFGGKGVSIRGGSLANPPFAVRTPNRGYACGLHMVPNANGLLYIGATNRLVTDHAFTRLATAGELISLLSGASRELSTNISRMQIDSIHVGYRPVTVDHRPLVGSTACPGIMVATGTWRNGVLLAPFLAELIVAEFCDGKSSYERFSPFRKILPPPIEDKVLSLYAKDMLDHLLDGYGRIPLQHHSEILTAMEYSLSQVFDLTKPTASSRVVLARRLWNRAPMREVIPSIWTLLTTESIPAEHSENNV